VLRDLKATAVNALRPWGRRRAAAVVAVATLAAGLGGVSSLSTFLDAVALRALPYRDGDRLVVIWETRARGGSSRLHAAPGRFLDWQRAATHLFGSMAAVHQWKTNLMSAGAPPRRVSVATVSPNLLELVGAQVVAGRGFLAADAEPGATPVALVSSTVSQERFGMGANAIGRNVTLYGRLHTVVGIVEHRTAFPPDTEIWLPLVIEYASRSDQSLLVLSSLREGVSLSAAAEGMSLLARQLALAYPDTDKHVGTEVVALRDLLAAHLTPNLLLLFFAVLLLLVTAAANLSNLALAMALERREEFRIRVALGARPLHLGKQIAQECAALCLVGAAVGFLFAQVGTRVLSTAGVFDSPLTRNVHTNPRVFGVTLLLLLLVTLLSALPAAFQVVRLGDAPLLRVQSLSRGRLRYGLGSALVATELCVTLVLLVATLFCLRGWTRLREVKPGFRPEQLISARLELPVSVYPRQRRVQVCEEVLDRVHPLPHVDAVAAAASLPMTAAGIRFRVIVEGKPPASFADTPTVEYRPVSPSYFRTMGIPLIRGDTLAAPTGSGLRPANVNQTMARVFFAGENPLGKRLSVEGPAGPWFTIVGVVGDVRHFGLGARVEPELYVPYASEPWPGFYLLVRYREQANGLVAAIRSQVAAVDPALPLDDVRRMDERIADSLKATYWTMNGLLFFAVTAALLSGLGVAAVLSQFVVEQKRELGIRMALGAQPSQVAVLVVRRAALPLVAGVSAGLLLVLALAPVAAGLASGTPSDDSLTIASATVFLLAVAGLAAVLPIRRAMAADPLTLLRC
jgi:putative ABC transport system permease protein